MRDSSVGGPLLWPADEAWPVCQNRHETLLAHVREHGFPKPSSVDGDALRLLADGGPVPLVPVAQLFRRDVPDFFGPVGTDLAQVLWCPLDHSYWSPEVTVFWRTAADVGNVLADPPRPRVFNEHYLPAACVVSPEQVIEHEWVELLPEPLQTRFEDDDLYDEYDAISVAGGWKVGGFTAWGLTGPYDVTCDCGEPMRMLLAATSAEPGRGGHPTAVTIGSGHTLSAWVCPADFTHPVQTSRQ